MAKKKRNLKHMLDLRHCFSSSSSAEFKASEIISGYSIDFKVILSRYEISEKSTKCGINLADWWRKEYFLKKLLFLSSRSVICGKNIHDICCFLFTSLNYLSGIFSPSSFILKNKFRVVFENQVLYKTFKC